jgi:hypothetical protein
VTDSIFRPLLHVSELLVMPNDIKKASRDLEKWETQGLDAGIIEDLDIDDFADKRRTRCRALTSFILWDLQFSVWVRLAFILYFILVYLFFLLCILYSFFVIADKSFVQVNENDDTLANLSAYQLCAIVFGFTSIFLAPGMVDSAHKVQADACAEGIWFRYLQRNFLRPAFRGLLVNLFKCLGYVDQDVDVDTEEEKHLRIHYQFSIKGIYTFLCNVCIPALCLMRLLYFINFFL